MVLSLRSMGATAAAGGLIGGVWLWQQRGRTLAGGNPAHALRPGSPLVVELESKHWVSHDAARLRFALPDEQQLGVPLPGHVVVVDAATNYRPYTPITIDSQARGYFELLVRHYPHGEFSSKLCRLQPGDQATFFGPVGNRFTYEPGMARRLGLVAAGTGIAPMWQIIQAVLADATDKTEISLVFACRSANDILLQAELERARAAHPEQLHIRYVVPRLEAGPSQPHVSVGRIDDPDLLRSALPKAGEESVKLLVCGPEGMLRTLCGPGARDTSDPNCRKPPLGGLLAQLGYLDSQVDWL